ncbi:MAG TPA: PKD domain-containing protein [Myxococcaceae bacterium]|jgi:hypothetical protein
MRSSLSSAPKVLLSVLCVVAVGLGGPGCRRAVKPDLGADRTVEAGVPQEFGSAQEGAAVVTWDFGDGAPSQTTSHAFHAFARSGTYTVRALDGSEEVGRVTLTVVPRPVLRAIPADATVALYVPRISEAVTPLVGFFEQLVGPDMARRQLEETPFLPIILESVRGGGSRVVDAEEGFGVFAVPSFDGSVALLGIVDGPPAMERVLQEFESAGRPVQRQPDGSARVEFAGEPAVLLFLDRGYLYLAMPEGPDEKTGEPVKAQAVMTPDVDAVRRHVTGFQGPGLSEAPMLTQLSGRVQPGSVYAFTSFPKGEGAEGFPGFFASLSVKEDRAELDGFMASDKPLLAGKPGPVPALLSRAPMGPVASAMVSVPAEEMANWLLGAPGSARRAEALAAWSARGLDSEGLISAVRGDVTLLVYFDAPAFYRSFLANKRPEPKGSVLFEAGLTRSEPVVAAVTKAFEGSSWSVEKGADKGTTRFRGRIAEQPVLLTVGPDRLSVQAGEAMEGRPTGDVGGALRTRFGAGAFSPSHLSLMVDLGRLRAELDAPEQVPGVPPAQLSAAKAFGGAFLDQVTPFDHAFMDFAPEQGGARLRGRVVLRKD